MSKNTTREHDRAVRAYMAQHAVPFSEARRALAATSQNEASGTVFSEWEGFTPEERRRRWDGVKPSAQPAPRPNASNAPPGPSP
ncbi:hypothetical protein ACJBCE_00285 [Streptomyces sp. NBUL23]|uniref:hypothetical protein n=1 Tax=Streptomyces sp. NBUL23 TaxID=3381354 RepID=UPI0038710E72